MANKFCTQCGTRLTPNARFCTACGTAVTDTGPDVTAKKPPQCTQKGRSLPWLPLILIVGGLIVMLAVFLTRANAPAVVEAPATPAVLDTTGLPFPDVPRISVADTHERVESGTAIIVDVRTAEEFAEAHIPTARLIPPSELEARHQELPGSAEIITYCT